MRKFLLVSFMLMVAVCSNAWAQATKNVAGKVTSALDGSPLPGVNVVVKGTTGGVTTDVDGKYSISVPETGAVLLFSFVGMNNTEVEVGDKSSIDIAMETDIAQLGEVIVTALGIQREKRSIGYAATQLEGKSLVNARETNMVQALAGKVAGVQVMGGGGTPGASSKIIIRGNRSFSGNSQPLFVIDGIPMDNQTSSTAGNDNPFNENLEQVNYSNRAIDINPNDIESMTVLKGPAAAALYGVRGGNGAIIITTKKGKLGNGCTPKTKVELSSSVDISKVNRLPQTQKKYAQGTYVGGVPTYLPYTAGDNGIFEAGLGDDIDGTSQSWGPTNSSLGITPTDNIGNFFETGITTSNDVSVSSGNEKSSFRLSFGQLAQKGVVPTTNFKRNTVRFTAQTELAKNLTASATVSYINSGGKRAQQGSNLSGVMLTLTRTPSSFDLGAGFEHPNGAQRTYLSFYDNPYWSLNRNSFKDNNERMLGNISLVYDPTDWLKVTYRAGADVYTDYRRNIFAKGANNDASTINGQIVENSQTHKELYADFIVTANKNITDKIAGSLTVGNNMNQRGDENVYARGRDLAVAGFYNMGNAATLYADQNTERQRSAAFFYDANISYDNMLFIGTTGRYEYSSTFGSNRRAFFFPSATASFVFTELGPLKDNKILNYGKLRFAAARAANVPDPYSAYTTRYSKPFFTDGYTNGFSFPYLGQNGYGKTNVLGNPDLKPEFTTSTEFGTELKFLNDRITADVTYYNQKTTDLILNQPVSYSTGHSAKISNGASLVNKGWEIALAGSPVKTENFEWNIDVNYTRNRNEIIGLADGIKELEIETGFGSPGVFAIVGSPYGAVYGTKWERNASGQLIIGSNGFPKITSTTSMVGDAYPKYTMGIRNTLTYKGFTLSGLLDIRQGGMMWNGSNGRLIALGVSDITEDRDRTYVIPGVKADGTANDIAVSGRNYFRNYLGDAASTEQNMQSTSWVRLREMSLGYTVKNVKFVQAIDVTLTGRNLWLKTDYTGIDPENSLTGAGSNYNGVDWFGMPNTKSYNIAVRITL